MGIKGVSKTFLEIQPLASSFQQLKKNSPLEELESTALRKARRAKGRLLPRGPHCSTGSAGSCSRQLPGC